MKTKWIKVYGIVQAVGFRPTIKRHSTKAKIKGTVCNKGPYVEIYAQGKEKNLDDFIDLIKYHSPSRSFILKIEVKEVEQEKYEEFTILPSSIEEGIRFISPDLAICEECEKELYNTHSRRYLHPFINCTSCGPRLTIIDRLPYDRVVTSMHQFKMCPTCKHEYKDIRSRFFDAQPISCPNCGPTLQLLNTTVKGMDALKIVRKQIVEDKIIAIKGIGGFHLCANAYSEKAVQLLRERKHRPYKPFAIMVKNIEVALKLAYLSEIEIKYLTNHQKPICLVKKKDNKLASSISFDLEKIGIMLPYTPLHHLLFDLNDDTKTPDALIMTSANYTDLPLVSNDEEANQYLTNIADSILTHNREILTKCDDTVLDFYQDKPYIVRRSRGFAPLPIMFDETYPSILALGADLKNTFSITNQNCLYPSSYIGNMGSFEALVNLKHTINRYIQALEIKPQVLVIDKHPQFFVNKLVQDYPLPVLSIQHHYAHMLSCMAENKLNEKVIGIIFDGTGYGEDGNIWGGEFLVGDCFNYTRMGHLDYFPLINGDLASKYPIYNLISINHYHQLSLPISHPYLSVLEKQCEQTSINTSSIGRLFDAFAAYIDPTINNTYEGQAAVMINEYAKKGKTIITKFPYLLINHKDKWMINTKYLFQLLINQKEKLSIEDLCFYFHELLVEASYQLIKEIKNKTGINQVVLSGGVFQNTLLLDLMIKKCQKEFIIYTHTLIPCNDGGISVGQAYYGMKNGGQLCV